MPRLLKKKSKVNFKDELVAGVSKPMSELQHETLWYFDHHVWSCPSCTDALEGSPNGHSLCPEGLQKAKAITSLLLKIRENGDIYYHDLQELQDIRLEVPTEYIRTRKLLKMIAASGEGFLRVSYDRTYPVTERVDIPYPVQDYEEKPRVRSRKEKPRRARDYEEKPRPVRDYRHYDDDDDDEEEEYVERKPRRSRSKRRSNKHPARKSHGSLAQIDLVEEEWNDRRESAYSYDDSNQYLPDWYLWQQYQALYNYHYGR